MPVVLRKNGFVFSFFSADGTEPPHVHVRKGSGSAKVWLKTGEIFNIKRLKSIEQRILRKIVKEHRDDFNAAWSTYFNG